MICFWQGRQLCEVHHHSGNAHGFGAEEGTELSGGHVCSLHGLLNGDLEALYDKSEGFFRRQLILQTKRKPPGRVDDPYLSDKLKQEVEGIFLWCLEGLKRLQSNSYRFTVSQRAAENKEHAKRNANNLVEFLQSEGYIQLKADSTITSRDLYAIYQMWCEDNGYRPIAQRSVSSYLKSHLEDYNLEASNKITNKSGKQVNGFWGIQALTAPIIL